MRLIDADALKENAYDSREWKNAEVGFHQMVVDIEDIDDAPTVDAVPVGVVEQFIWERDMAIQQLEEHGIPFCGKAYVVAVVRCKECKHRPKYDGPNRLVFPDEVCPCQCDDLYYNWMPSDDWYCADGERKDDAAD